MSEKKEFDVCLPITGVVYVTVEAEDKESAITAALNSDLSLDDIEEWEAHRHITQGNVFYGNQNSASAEEA